jgi:hypothetical protein
MQHFPKNLWASVRAYYKWHDGKKIKLVKWIKNKLGVEALVVHFEDKDGDELTGLMFCERIGDYWYLSEFEYSSRKDENDLIQYYESGPHINEFDDEEDFL